MSERRVERVKVYHCYEKNTHTTDVEVVYDDGLLDHVDFIDNGRILYCPESLIGRTPKEVAEFYKDLCETKRRIYGYFDEYRLMDWVEQGRLAGIPSDDSVLDAADHISTS